MFHKGTYRAVPGPLPHTIKLYKQSHEMFRILFKYGSIGQERNRREGLKKISEATINVLTRLMQNSSKNILYWSPFCKNFSGTLTNCKSSRQVSQFLLTAQLSKKPGVDEDNLQKPLQSTLHSDQ
jgi:hypothetical protein